MVSVTQQKFPVKKNRFAAQKKALSVVVTASPQGQDVVCHPENM
jgi:hypothetical protein